MKTTALFIAMISSLPLHCLGTRGRQTKLPHVLGDGRLALAFVSGGKNNRITTRRQQSSLASPLHFALQSRIASAIASDGNPNTANNHSILSSVLKMASGNNESPETTADEDDATTTLSSRQPSPWENPKSAVGNLLESATSRAFRTLADNNGSAWDGDTTVTAGSAGAPSVEKLIDATIVRTTSVLDGRGFDGSDSLSGTGDATAAAAPSVDNLIDATILRTTSTLESTSSDDDDANNSNHSSNDNNSQKQPPKKKKKTPKPHKDKRTYLGNPSVTPTALAHSLWESTILPYEDTIIDATCGNGKDCLALARMLFPDSDDSVEMASSTTTKPQLIGIDIQSRAIQNTKQSLLSSLPSEIFYNHVTLLEQSHEHLMKVPRDTNSVGLVCYNLGYLPGAPSLSSTSSKVSSTSSSFDYKECQTQTATTIHSITDASLLLRVGGLLSVMTYPGSNLEESLVVEHFVEGLAMLTTKKEGGWRRYVDGIPDYDEDGDNDGDEKEEGGTVRRLVTQALERVVNEGAKGQTWRTFLHKPLGRPLSPILVTAMRIK